jgi:hypothetical protein
MYRANAIVRNDHFDRAASCLAPHQALEVCLNPAHVWRVILSDVQNVVTIIVGRGVLIAHAHWALTQLACLADLDQRPAPLSLR